MARAGVVRQAGAAFAFRDYRLFWTGAVVSNIGTWMQNVTVPYVLYQLTHRGAWVGLAVVAQVLPSLLLNPLSGSLADRFSRRELLRVSNVLQGIAAFGLWGLWVSGSRSPVAILVLVAIGGTTAMTTQPAWQALVPDLVPDEHRANAITLNSAQANTARAVGPALGGIVLGTLGAGWAFLLNGVSFMAVIVVLSIVQAPDRHVGGLEGRVLQQYREAAVYARRNVVLLEAFVFTAVVCGLANPVFQMTTLFVRRVYHAGPGLYGALTGCYGAGALIGAFLLGAFGGRRSSRRVLVVSIIVQGAAMVGFGMARTFALGAPLLAILGGGTLVAIATLNTTIQSAAPEALRGRLLALWVLSYSLSYPLGSLLQGTVADHIGPGATVAVAGVVLGLIGVALRLRRYGRDDHGTNDYGAEPCPSSPPVTTPPADASPSW